MSRSRNHFEEFKPHSRHKHLILEHYFKAWGHKHGMGAGAVDKILYVDACAGRGADDVGNHGSPLIAAEAAAEAQANVSGLRGSPFHIQVVAIEAKHTYYKKLKALLAPFGDDVRTLHGELGHHITAIESEFGTAPTLYFIDPFGLNPLQAALVRRALTGEKHEALLLFADSAALRHFGAIASTETRSERRFRSIADSMGAQPSLFAADEAKNVLRLHELSDVADRSRQQLSMSSARATKILNTAFDSEDWRDVIESTPKGARREAFLSLYVERLRKWGATHIIRIPIITEDGTTAYTLIHASKSPKAFVAMKEAVASALKYSPLPTDVVDRMKRLVGGDLDAVEAAILRRFASSQVRWAEDRTDKRAPSVKHFVLEGTDAFPFDEPELKERLERFRIPGQSIIYTFPGAPTDVD